LLMLLILLFSGLRMVLFCGLSLFLPFFLALALLLLILA
jgi:hypothetical protein